MQKYKCLITFTITMIISILLTPTYKHTDVYVNNNTVYDIKEKSSTLMTHETVLVGLEPMLSSCETKPVETKPVETKSPVTKPCEYSKTELSLLAHLISAEAGSDWCSDEMQYYVGSVVLNRMASDQFPDTMYEVIYQKGQYACVDNGMINREPCDRAWRIARDLLINGSVLPKKVIFQAEFEQGNGTYCKEQNMYFCYN